MRDVQVDMAKAQRFDRRALIGFGTLAALLAVALLVARIVNG